MTQAPNQLAKRTDTPLAHASTLDVPQQWELLEHPHIKESGSSIRIGLWTLALALGGFMLWASLAPLDEGVPSMGMVAIDTKRKPIQHLTGGIVKEVLVREGEVVKEGQVLARLDDVLSGSNYESMRQTYLGLRAIESRLEAEILGAKAIQFHADLMVTPSTPLIEKLKFAQTQLFQSRKDALRADLGAIEENIEGLSAMLIAYKENVGNRASQRTLLMEELTNTRELVKDGFTPRNRQLELERAVAESNATLADLQGNISRVKRSVRELRLRAVARTKEYRKEVESQLTDVSRQAQVEGLRLKVAQDDLGRTELKAPVAGQVMGLVIQAPGSVLQGGQKLMDIVPQNETLLLEAHVSPTLIDQVRAGLPVDIRFSAFAHSPLLVVEGKVVSVSNDLNIEPSGNFYLARVAITPEGSKTLGARQLHPGMPVEVVFKTGERTLLDYLLHPLTKRMAAAMKEE
jgi:protease secretion system membrane fusion protein